MDLAASAPDAALASPGPARSPAGRRSYLPGLDTLRAIAALSVCVYHFTGGMLPKLLVPSLKAFFSPGYLGVDIFFVISGFIIPYSLVGKNHRIAGFFAYLKKRILRINPPAYASLVLVLAQGLVIDKLINHNSYYTDKLSWGRLLHNLLFTVPFTHYTWINGIFWTLAIEFQFYLFIGLLFSALFERGWVWFVALYVAATLLQYLPLADKENFFRYAPLFALGGIALLWNQKRIAWWGFLAGLLFFGGLAYSELGIYSAVVSVGTAVAINAIRISVPGFSFLGKMSYSLYLLHGLIGPTAEFVVVRVLPPSTDGRKMLLTSLCLLLTIAGSYLFYQLVEQPFMRLAAQNRR